MLQKHVLLFISGLISAYRINSLHLSKPKKKKISTYIKITENKPESARDNIFNPYNSCSLDQPLSKAQQQQNENSQLQQNSMQKTENSFNSSSSSSSANAIASPLACSQQNNNHNSMSSSSSLHHHHHHHHNGHNSDTLGSCHLSEVNGSSNPLNSHYSPSIANNANHNNSANSNSNTTVPMRKRCSSSNNIDKDLEILDRELSAINSPMPMIDPEITQGAEQLEKALSSRKRQRSEDESDRLVREALTQFYIPPQRLISAIDDCPLDMVNVGSLSPKRPKMSGGPNDLDLEFDMNQNQKDFEVIMDALRLGSPSPTPSVGSDSCGQAAMMSESANVFHNLVVTSLET
uniref:Uncharacterized protein n=1 Tax=Stomoxys calcitrans TaxID=35570 RepID=A0A1I8P7J1_STOCA